MKKQLTIKQALNRLPFPYNVMAIEENQRYWNKFHFEHTNPNGLISTPASAIMFGLSWNSSDMGADFWEAIHEQCFINKL